MPDETSVEALTGDHTENLPPEMSSKELDQTMAEIMYPVASSLFQVSVKPLKAIKDDSYIFLDANILLQPYQRNAKGRDEIKRTYLGLITQNRLFVAGQASREFAKNRTVLLNNLYNELNTSQSQTWERSPVKKIDAFNKEILKWLGAEHAIDEKLKAANKAIEDFNLEYDKVQAAIKLWKADIGKIISDFKAFRWNDPVSDMYASIFTSDMIIEPTTSRELIKADFKHRDRHNLPPGFGDANKGDATHPYEGMGDLLIWHTILDKAEADKKNVIFVSNDTNKGDWWVVNGKTPLFPRFELVDEFYRRTGGCSFHIITFSEFLSLYEVAKEVVEEVREEEAEQEIINTSASTRDSDLVEVGFVVDSAIGRWLHERYPVVYASSSNLYNYIVMPVQGTTERYIVNVKVYKKTEAGATLRISVFIREAVQEFEDSKALMKDANISGQLLVLVFPNSKTAEFVYQNINTISGFAPSFPISLGFLDRNEFQEVAQVTVKD